MRDQDSFVDDDEGPSRSQRRREALDIFKLAETLAASSEAELARVPLSDELRDEVARTRAVTSHIARKRATQFLAKQLRKLDDDEIEPIRRALANDRAEAHREAAALHRLESWRTRLINEGDGALDELCVQYPSANRQQIRQLARNARKEIDQQRPPHSLRLLLRMLRSIAGN